jgi:hypothetical protein
MVAWEELANHNGTAVLEGRSGRPSQKPLTFAPSKTWRIDALSPVRAAVSETSVFRPPARVIGAGRCQWFSAISEFERASYTERSEPDSPALSVKGGGWGGHGWRCQRIRWPGSRRGRRPASSECPRQPLAGGCAKNPGKGRWALAQTYCCICAAALRTFWDLAGTKNGGESGIRTHGRVTPTHAFQACSFNRSDISPQGALGRANIEE